MLLPEILMVSQNGFDYNYFNMVSKFEWWIKSFGCQEEKFLDCHFVDYQVIKKKNT